MTIPIYIIYKITNLINNKIYIGVHKTTNPNDSYMGSGTAIKSSILKYGKLNFNKEILFKYDNSKDAYIKESKIVNDVFVYRKDTYNLVCGGAGSSTFHSNKKWDDLRKHKKSIQMKGNIPWNKGMIMDDEFKSKISKSMYGSSRALGSKHTPMAKLKNALRSVNGLIYTPFNKIYPSPKIAELNGCSTKIREWCGKENQKIITKYQYTRNLYLNQNFSSDIIGKTFGEIGFKLIDKNNLTEKELIQMAKYYS